MTNLFFPSKITRQSVEQKMELVNALLAGIVSPSKDRFLSLVQKRINEFETELSSDHFNEPEKTLIIEQYFRFAKTLHQCLKHPQRTTGSVEYYHRQFYYPVGIRDIEKPNPLANDLALTSTALSLSLLVGCIPAFVFYPVIGTIMLAVAITLLFPSCFILLIPASPDTHKKKEEERLLFQIGAQLIQADLECDTTPVDHQASPGNDEIFNSSYP